jgi:hypothetical protein
VTGPDYLLANRAPEAVDRFTAFAALFDPSTFRHFDDLGLARPGGWVLVEDADPALQPLACLEEHGPAEVLANRIRTGFRALLAGRGADLSYGRTLPRRLRAAGLTEAAADASFPVSVPACADLEAASVRLIRDQLIAHDIASEQEVDRHLAAVATGALDLTRPPMIACWGRKPA